MPATVEIRSFHGAVADAGTNVAGGAVRFKQADNDTIDAANPIPIPAAGTAYSFIKQFKFFAATTPANTINNLSFYTDGANGLGTGVGLVAKTGATYTDPIALGAADMTLGTNAFTFTSAAPLAVTGSINNPSTGAFGDFIKVQLTVGTTAAQGTTPTENLTYQFDES